MELFSSILFGEKAPRNLSWCKMKTKRSSRKHYQSHLRRGPSYSTEWSIRSLAAEGVRIVLGQRQTFLWATKFSLHPSSLSRKGRSRRNRSDPSPLCAVNSSSIKTLSEFAFHRRFPNRPGHPGNFLERPILAVCP